MKFVASIPATSANLGPGFDSIGLALNLWNRFELHPQPRSTPVSVETHGESRASLPSDQTNLIAQIILEEMRRLSPAHLSLAHQLSLPLPSFRLVCHNHVPAGSGLGSSYTAVLSGLMLAHAYMQWLQDEPVILDREKILSQAVTHEGHGDNVAPAMLGGLVIVATDKAGLIAQKVLLPPLQVVVCVPDFYFLTSQARTDVVRM